jgi:hypothetical protein
VTASPGMEIWQSTLQLFIAKPLGPGTWYIFSLPLNVYMYLRLFLSRRLRKRIYIADLRLLPESIRDEDQIEGRGRHWRAETDKVRMQFDQTLSSQSMAHSRARLHGQKVMETNNNNARALVILVLVLVLDRQCRCSTGSAAAAPRGRYGSAAGRSAAPPSR